MWINDTNNLPITRQQRKQNKMNTKNIFWSNKTMNESTTDLNKHNRSNVNPPPTESDPPDAHAHTYMHVIYI